VPAALLLLAQLWRTASNRLTDAELVMVQESRRPGQPAAHPGKAAMTVAVFLGALLGAMALGMPIAYALLVCGVALMAWHLDQFDTADPGAEPDQRRRQLSAAGGALLHARRRDHERGRPVRRIVTWRSPWWATCAAAWATSPSWRRC
jgi:hypothetical protein